MSTPLNIMLQRCCPQHLLSQFAGWLAESRQPWLKRRLINYFINKFNIDTKLALIENPEEYPTFNSYFTRLLKPELRPIVRGEQQVASPADGSISQIGRIEDNDLLQAKGHHFSLQTLVGGSSEIAAHFKNGHFATIYLAPKDYHRVHMPLAGKLRKTIFIPGDLFSVNQYTAQTVPNLFARNERLVCIFDTAAGPMAVILVGAMLVGSISTVWQKEYISTKTVVVNDYPDGIQLEKGAEMGLFKMGSTVILLFPRNTINWADNLEETAIVQMGQWFGDRLK